MNIKRRDIIITIIIISAMILLYWSGVGLVIWRGVMFTIPNLDGVLERTPTDEEIIEIREILKERKSLESFILIEGNTLVGVSCVYYPKTYTYAILIDKLIMCESSGNPKALGKANEKGILQFKDQTFQHFCVNRYGLENNIWDSETQKHCCDLMLSEGYHNHWACWEIVN